MKKMIFQNETVVGERDQKNFWAMLSTKWYVAQKAKDEETPNEIKKKRKIYNYCHVYV